MEKSEASNNQLPSVKQKSNSIKDVVHDRAFQVTVLAKLVLAHLQALIICSVCIIVAVIIGLITLILIASKREYNEELVFVNMVIGHSANDVYSTKFNDMFFYGPGQLTEEGIRESVEFGRKLRQKYIVERKLLSTVMNVRQFRIRAPNKERCLGSGLLLGQGMFSGAERTIPLPVPVMGQDTRDDDMLAPYWYNCPKNEAIFKSKCPSYKPMPTYEDFFATCFVCMNYTKTSKYFKTYDSAKRIEGIVNEYNANIMNNPTLAIDEAKDIYAKVQAFSSGVYPFPDLDLAALHGNDVMYTWVQNLELAAACAKGEAAASANCDYKLFVCSTEGFLISTLLEMLDLKKAVLDDKMPSFTAAILMELYKVTGNIFYVKVYFRESAKNGEFVDFTPRARGCKGLRKCPLDNFLSAMKPIIRPTRKQLCKEKKT